MKKDVAKKKLEEIGRLDFRTELVDHISELEELPLEYVKQFFDVKFQVGLRYIRQQLGERIHKYPKVLSVLGTEPKTAHKCNFCGRAYDN